MRDVDPEGHLTETELLALLEQRGYQCQQLQADIDALHASTSWRLTAPVRAAGTVVRLPRVLARRGLLAMRLGTATRVRRSPRLHAGARWLIGSFPPLEAPLRRAFNMPKASATRTIPFALEPEPDALHEWQRLLQTQKRAGDMGA